MSAISKGNIAPRDVAGTEITISVEGDSGTIVRRGSYAQLESSKPAIGTLISSQGAQLNVLATNLRKERGGLGTLTITLGDKDRTGEGMVSLAAREETVELDYSLMEKPIESHPMFKDIFAPEGGDFTALASIRAWEAEQEPTVKGQFMYLEHGGVLDRPYLTFGRSAGLRREEARRDRVLFLASAHRPENICHQARGHNVEVRNAGHPSRALPPFRTWLKTADKMTRTGSKGSGTNRRVDRVRPVGRRSLSYAVTCQRSRTSHVPEQACKPRTSPTLSASSSTIAVRSRPAPPRRFASRRPRPAQRFMPSRVLGRALLVEPRVAR